MICMEMLHRSLHEVYKLVYDKLGDRIPERVVGRMAESVSLFSSFIIYVSFHIV